MVYFGITSRTARPTSTGQRAASHAVLPDGPAKAAGIAAGEAAAAAMIAHRANDGSATPVAYTPQGRQDAIDIQFAGA